MKIISFSIFFIIGSINSNLLCKEASFSNCESITNLRLKLKNIKSFSPGDELMGEAPDNNCISEIMTKTKEQTLDSLLCEKSENSIVCCSKTKYFQALKNKLKLRLKRKLKEKNISRNERNHKCMKIELDSKDHCLEDSEPVKISYDSIPKHILKEFQELNSVEFNECYTRLMAALKVPVEETSISKCGKVPGYAVCCNQGRTGLEKNSEDTEIGKEKQNSQTKEKSELKIEGNEPIRQLHEIPKIKAVIPELVSTQREILKSQML